jgi:hypothetical protein
MVVQLSEAMQAQNMNLDVWRSFEGLVSRSVGVNEFHVFAQVSK